VHFRLLLQALKSCLHTPGSLHQLQEKLCGVGEGHPGYVLLLLRFLLLLLLLPVCVIRGRVECGVSVRVSRCCTRHTLCEQLELQHLLAQLQRPRFAGGRAAERPGHQ
jgi:hypothetical protein